MEYLAVQDVRKIVRLLGDVAVLDTDTAGKRRFLLEGMAKLVEADVWVWVHFHDNAKDGIPMCFAFIEGGWANEAQLMLYAEATTTPAAKDFNAAMRIGSEVHRTRKRADVYSDPEWFSSELFQNYYAKADLGDWISSSYPLGDRYFSTIALLRHLDRPKFAPRDVCIVHVLTEEIDWLHREGTNIPASEHVNKLSPRQRQVLLRLLAGEGIKQIARRLSLSGHTVNDHMKEIYRRFGVSGRSELVSKFLAGGQDRRSDEQP
jgi:DNA-binding CsgD family transcriptional regulator